jgi:RNase P subunit RPR2
MYPFNMPKGQKKLIKTSVRASIAHLLEEAEKSHKTAEQAQESGNRKLATQNRTRTTRYVRMIMDLVKKHKVRLGKDQKNKFCKKCNTWWVPGKTVKLIYDQKHQVIRVKCQCGHSRRL